MDVSVIIVNWNTKDILRDCLKSVCRQTTNIDYEIIVVDNASTDGSSELVKKRFPQVILLENCENIGFAAANNRGLSIAKGRYVLMLNSDTIMLENTIEKVSEFADGHPNAAVVGCRVLNVDQTLQSTCFMFPSLLNMLLETFYLNKLFPKNRLFGREMMSWWKRDDVREVDVVTGCFMLVRREAVEQVGVMDEQFFVYAEETDWCYRFKKAGWKSIFTPCAEIIHLGGASSSQRKPEMVLQLRGSILLFLKKHKGFWIHTLACLLVALFFLLRIPYWLAMAIIAGNDRDNHFQTVRTYLKGVLKALRGGRGLCVE